jgi:hypothetical protein
VGYGALLSAKDKNRRQWKMRNKKLLSLVLALAFVFSAMGLAFAPSSAMAANQGQVLSGDAIPPYPLNPDPDNASAYLVPEEPATGPINVTVIIEAGDAIDTEEGEPIPDTAFRREISVRFGSTGEANTVTSLLMALDGTNGLKFYGEEDDEIADFTDTTNYLAAVEVTGETGTNIWVDGAITYYFGFNGWTFRVNDQFPAEALGDDPTDGYRGTDILDTPLENGDVVHFFYDFPTAPSPAVGSVAANYVRAKLDSFNAGTLVVQLQGHKTDIDPLDYTMSVFNYVDLDEDVTASIYTDRGVYVGNAVPDGIADGKVTFSSGSLVAGKTYVVKTTPTYYYTDNPTWGDWINGAFFALTGAYTKITIPVSN